MGTLTAHCETTVLSVLLLPEQYTTFAFKDVTEEGVGGELGVTRKGQLLAEISLLLKRKIKHKI